ncbi:hypothetical protein M9Y10_016323 [Tritrichomonas musculus]|uniref:UDENN domain-containing protein n=1 Tax=Tritrichomonas musculus TaxID=1915356 RepID=A0ABR2HVX1_9EUKA
MERYGTPKKIFMINFQSQPDAPPFNYICRAWMNEQRKCEVEDLFVLAPQYQEKYVPHIGRFCFPYEENDIHDKTFFSFCLTDADKNYSYCFAYSAKRKVVINNEEKNKHSIFALFSSYYHPYFLNEIIFEVSNLFNKNPNDCHSFIDHFSKIVLTQDKYDWTYDDNCCIWMNDNCSYELKCNRLLSPDNEIGSCLKFMFENFSAHFLLSAIVAMMNDFRIIVISSKPEYLGKACFGLLSLIYPITWNGTFIPIVPSSLSDMLDSPIAYIDGVHSSMAEHIYTTGFGSYFVINVDLHSCASIETNDFPDSVMNAINSSAEEIKRDISIYQCKEIFPASRIIKLLKRFVVKIYASLFEIQPTLISNSIQPNTVNSGGSDGITNTSISSISDSRNIYNTAYADPDEIYKYYLNFRNEFENDMKYSICQTQFSLQFFRKLIESKDDTLFRKYFPGEMKPIGKLLEDEFKKTASYNLEAIRSTQTNDSRHSPMIFNRQGNNASIFDINASDNEG